MSKASLADAETVLEQDDDQLKEELPELLPAIESDLETFLVQHPSAFEQLVTRMATLEDPADYVEAEQETVEVFFEVMWTGLNLITETIPSAREAVDTDVSVQWICEDTDLAWHMEADADSGIISGGAGELEDAELTFRGDTDTMLSMIGDEDFNGQQAFMQGEFQIEGPIPKATMLEQMMTGVTENTEDFT